MYVCMYVCMTCLWSCDGKYSKEVNGAETGDESNDAA